MKKIILKAKLGNRDAVEAALEAAGHDIMPMYWQHDRIYVPRGYRPQSNYPRLIMRTDLHAIDEQPEYSLILRRHIEDSGVDIVEQTPVADYATTVNIILQLGFKQMAEVSRRREDVTTEEGITFHLDNIDGRNASYIKIERELKDAESTEEVRNDLAATLMSLGEQDIVNKPYFEL